ncbi:MAG: hypothetical protein HDS75_05195 [Bacteroidales bacterium]|nr:hypothetical protein [Bacteroidales bacterium]MDE6802200.1 hypothetical protein [Muribaculaceae bacterium]
MNDEIKNKISALMSQLPGSKQLSALQLNNVRFCGNRSAITPAAMRKSKTDIKKD